MTTFDETYIYLYLFDISHNVIWQMHLSFENIALQWNDTAGVPFTKKDQLNSSMDK